MTDTSFPHNRQTSVTMKHIKSLYIVLATLLLAACQTEQWENPGGGFLISLGEDVTVTTKSTPAELGKPTTDQFTLKIVKESTHNTLYEGAYTSSIIPASAGFYTVTATCGNNPVLALDAPYYKGEQTGVEVTEGTEPTSVSLTCSVANALTSVVYSNTEKFDDLFSSYAVTITAGQQSVAIGKEQAAKSAYYQAGTIPTFQFTGTLKDNGQEVSMPLEDEKLTAPATFAAAKHCKLTLSVKPTASGVILTVEKVEVENVTISETIPVEWLPAPKINGFADGQTSLTYTETDPAIPAQLNFTGSLAIQDVEFSFNFQDPQEQFQALNGKTFLLSQLSEEDRTLLNAAHIILPSLNGEKEGHFDFTAMTNYLQTLSGGADAVNIIKLRVQANNRWSNEEPATYEIRTVKPEFSVSVNANNCWSREFTIDEITATTGNAETLKSDLIYQYFNGTEWVECATREAVKGRTQQFNAPAENIAQKTYRVRALYRGTIASTEAEATLETPVQLPNSGMEEWNYEIYTKSLYCFYPWQDKGDCHWDTNNLYTTRHRHNSSNAVIQNYNGFHAVSYVTGRDNKGLAAELRSTANGRGNTDDFLFVKHDEKDQNKVAGELFLGDCKLNLTGNDIDGNDTYEREKNAIFTNRPTALKFWYKYAPYTSDTWSVHIELLNENKDIIIQTDYTSSESVSTWAEQTVTLNYAEETPYEKCKYIYVIFSSTTNAGANMPYREITQTFYVDGQENTFNPAYIGSVLTIDDISLIYDK